MTLRSIVTPIALVSAAMQISSAQAAPAGAGALSLQASAGADASSVPICSKTLKTGCKRKSGGNWVLIGAGVAAVIGAIAASAGNSSSP